MKERGRESLTTNTIHFIILLTFHEDKDLRILESVNKKATELKVSFCLLVKVDHLIVNGD